MQLHCDERSDWFPTSAIPKKRQTIQKMMVDMTKELRPADTKKEQINIIDDDDDDLEIIEIGLDF